MVVLSLFAGVLAALGPASGAAAAPPSQRDVLVVSNNWAGTADLIDPHTFKRFGRIDVVPDRAERIAEIEADPGDKLIYDGIRALVGEGHDQYVDDGFTSKDGRYVYFSRPSFADVVAIDLKTEKIAWRVKVDGNRADHMALSPDGRRLLVSASTARVVDVIDTATHTIVGRIPSGDQPHENNFSRDGRLIFHASIGTVYSDRRPVPGRDQGRACLRDHRRAHARGEAPHRHGQEAGRVRRAGHELRRKADGDLAGRALRLLPAVVLPRLRGVRPEARSPRRLAFLPLSAHAKTLTRQDYLLDSAHHGLTINRRGTKFCVAGTMSNYAAIVLRRTLQPQRVIPVGRVPYWSTTSRDGRYCFVSVAGEDRVSVISWKTAREVARIRVGDHPQRMRAGTVQARLLRR